MALDGPQINQSNCTLISNYTVLYKYHCYQRAVLTFTQILVLF